MKLKIASTGYYVPDKILTNDELSQFVETSDEWIYSHTGIRFRRIAGDEQATSDLAYRACLRALERAGKTADDVDLIVVATSTPDYVGFPSTACLVQDLLGAKNAGAFDVMAACTGFVYALETARNFLLGSSVRSVLVVGAEVFSRVVDWKDRNTCVLFGDAAGAVLLEATDEASGEFYPSILRSDGSGASALLRKAGGTRQPRASLDALSDETCVSMDGRRVYNFAVKAIKDTIVEILEKNDLTLDDVKWIVPHQANVRIVDAAANRLQIPLSRFYLNMEQYANTSAASIPLALAEMDEKQFMKRGDLILTVGFGAGLTYGANLFRW